MNRAKYTFLTALCGLIGVLALGATSASATNSHVLALQSAPFSQANAFAGPRGVAVDQETGNLYVLDRSSQVVDIFGGEGGSPAGGVPTQITGLPAGSVALAVDNACWHHRPRLTGAECEAFDPSNGDVYVANISKGPIDKYRLNAVSKEYEAAGSLEVGGEPEGVAVDDEGNVYVANWESTAIAVFGPSGVQIGDIAQFISGHPHSVAVGKPGVIYVGDYSSGVARIEAGPSASFALGESALSEVPPLGKTVAVNGQGGLYSDNGSLIREFDSSGMESAAFGSGDLTSSPGIAVNEETDYVYAVDRGEGRVVAFRPAVSAEPTVGAASSFPSTSSATFEGTVNPAGTTVSACEFEYGTTPGVYSGKAPCTQPPPFTGEQALPVTATITGLTQGTTYYYRLAVTNENGTATSGELKLLMPLTIVVEAESASFVETKTALLEATVNPGGAQTAYHFEYGKSAGSYEVSVPVPDRDVAAGLTGVRVSVGAVHLAPGTTYHYRVVASNGLPGAVVGQDQAFTTVAAEGGGVPVACGNENIRSEQADGVELPDCRAYEMVSPLNKNGNSVSVGLARASVSGNAVTYDAMGSFGQPHGAELWSRYVSRRGPHGWATQNISPAFAAQKTNVYSPFEALLFTPELSKGVVRSFYTKLPSGAPSPFIDLYVADFATGGYERVNYAEPSQASPYGGYYESPVMEGGSNDLSRVVFEQKAKLTPEAAEEGYPVQAYDWFEGHLHLLSISPMGAAFKGESFIGGGGGEIEVDAGKAWHAISADGSRVFFGGAEEEYGTPLLYLRENPERPQSPVVAGKCTVTTDACTVEVSASQRNPQDPHGPQPALFAGASADGSRVFFTSRSELTEDAFTGSSDNVANLYEYDVETGVLHDLTVDNEGGAAVLDVVSAAEDGSYVYFIADSGELAGNENGQSEKAVNGKPNLFVYHAGRVRFIATLAGGGAEGSDARDWEERGGPLENTARASADGTHLAFESVRSLTGYDNRPAKAGGCEGEPCREVYLYDATSEQLVCASCDPNGTRPEGPAELGGLGRGARQAGGWVEIYGSTLHVDNNLSEDGSRLFFESPDALVASDSNGRRDVYEYENGRVRPVSDVRGGSSSFFLDASPSGNDVFIATADQLVGADKDGLIDVYDARIGGGFAEPAAPPECDNGDSCRAPISPQPSVYGAPSSATLTARGNMTAVTQKVKARSKPKPCRKGRKRKRGKCVKVKSRRSSKANGSSKRSGGRGK